MQTIDHQLMPGLARQAFAIAMAVGLVHIAVPMLFGPWLALAYLARTHQPSGLSHLQIMSAGIVAVPVGAAMLAVIYRIGRWGGVWR